VGRDTGVGAAASGTAPGAVFASGRPDRAAHGPASKATLVSPAWGTRGGVLGTALVVGLSALLWPQGSSSGAVAADVGPLLNDQPFYMAVSDLALQPVAHYTGSTPDGGSWDLNVTGGGEGIGTVTEDGQQIDVLSVAGKTYVKPPQSLLNDLPSGQQASSLQGKWLTGDEALTSVLPAMPEGPADMADRLWQSLAGATDFPLPDAPPTTFDGTPALKVTTPDGVLYVSDAEPYRVLGLVAAAPSDALTTPTAPISPTAPADSSSGTPSFPALLDAPVRAAGLRPAAAAGGFGPMNFQPVSVSDADRAFANLIDQTRGLSDAVNLGITFDFDQGHSLNCTDASLCTISVNVATSATIAAPAGLSGNVVADMTADVTVDGQAAGGCSASQTLPIDGSGTITCQDPDVAPIVQNIKAEKQREADQQAQASGHDVNIPYNLDFNAAIQIQAKANVQADVDRDVNTEKGEQDSADVPPPCPANTSPEAWFRNGDSTDSAGATAPAENAENAALVLAQNSGGSTAPNNPWNSAQRWTSGDFPLGGAIDAGGPKNGILYRAVNGKVTNYAEYDGDGMIMRRVDVVGGAHGRPPVPTPHIHDYARNPAPNGKVYPKPNKVAKPTSASDLPPANFCPAP
jgi:hypothetical protein